MSDPASVPSQCPRCHATGSLYVRKDGFECRLCGYRQTSPHQHADDVPLSVSERRARLHPSYRIDEPERISPWARTKFTSALDAVCRQDWDAALRSLQQALEYQPDFLEAHLWIARIAADETTRRKHLGEVLSLVPNHDEALRELMVLNGEISEEDAARLAAGEGAPVRELETAVGAKVAAPRCPQCGGALVQEQGHVVCRQCGYTATGPSASTAPASKPLVTALLKRRSQPVIWRVKQHVLRCEQCGASHVQARALATECPFCGSAQIVQQDALGSLQQPDAVLPFALDQRTAQAALAKALGSLWERFKGLFDPNRPETVRWHSAYVPAWLFDALVKVTPPLIMGSAFRNILIHASPTPPTALLYKLRPWNFDALAPYRPTLLSGHAAQLYTLDFDKASLQARRHIARSVQRYAETDDEEQAPHVRHTVYSMSYRLVMLPVWIAHIREVDGEMRLALVNGQSGRAGLGHAK